jgi:LAO/AO transport system kinase
MAETVTKDIKDLVQKLRQGDKKAAARLITLAENRDPSLTGILPEIYHETGEAHVIGITGSPGVGKSTLIDRLITAFRKLNRKVGIITVDPTSPYSGGAFLGDRIRMQNHTTDPDVFIRSLATRGNPGGVSIATQDVIRILDAWGADEILVETVGAGQSETGVMRVADTVVLILSPGAGDEIQSLKSGIMEIANLYVVNKSDLEGVDIVLVDVKRLLSMERSSNGWIPPVIKVSAKTGEGIQELIKRIGNHWKFLKDHPNKDVEKRKAKDMILAILREISADFVITSVESSNLMQKIVNEVKDRKMDPYTGAAKLLSKSIIGSPTIIGRENKLDIGLTQVYTGDGKGKTSAALGLALRALGRGLRIHVIQFLKGHRDYGEHLIADKIPGLDITVWGREEFIGNTPTTGDKALAQEALKRSQEIINSGNYDIVILDEVNVALKLDLIKLDDVLGIITSKPDNLELILTGRSAPHEIVEVADLVTEMREIKHPFKKGVKARKSIEF